MKKLKSCFKKPEKLQKLKMDTPQIIEVPTEELKNKVYEKLNELNFAWRNSDSYILTRDLKSSMTYPFYLCPLRGTWDAEAYVYENYTIISAEEWLGRFEEDKSQLLAVYPYPHPWSREEAEEVKEKKEVEKKKEVAGVDFVYGLDIKGGPIDGECHGCCLLEYGDPAEGDLVCEVGTENCDAGNNGVYFLTKIPRKRPHVKGMAAIGAWIEEKGLVVSSAGSLVFWSDEHGYYSMKNLFIYAGKEIPGDDFIPEEFADLIEYK